MLRKVIGGIRLQLIGIFLQYDDSGISQFWEIDSSQGQNDYRRVYLVNYASGEKLAIKVTNNCFTTPKRIHGWADLIEHYNSAGIYAPSLVRTREGQFCFSAGDKIVYAEEWKKFLCAHEFTPPVAFSEYEEDLYTTIGKIGALPKTAFQGDLNRTNIMLDQSRRFAGVIDFNTSGTETILNYALCESVPKITEDRELARLGEGAFRQQHDQILQRRLGYIQRHYTFTPQERAAFPKLYNVVVPFRWPTFCNFRRAVHQKQEKYYHAIIDWVWYQLTRTDLLEWFPCK